MESEARADWFMETTRQDRTQCYAQERERKLDNNLDSTVDWLEECLETAVVQPGSAPDGQEHVRQGSLKEESTENHCKLATKRHSTPLTLEWLEDNYEVAEGVCIPRCTLYVHYLDFCKKNDSQPVNAASFGKIIRQQFPNITTRRLGTRGASKYHYYGIGVKESSIYYEVNFSKNGVQSSQDGKRGNIKQIVAYSPRSKLGTLLPDFPNVKDLKLPSNVTEDKVTTFLMMYRTHCQRILDTVIRANFDEVHSFLLHFWQGMPPHIVPILGNPVIVSLVGVCDSILYKAVAGVLMPTVLQALPDSLTQVIRKFARQLDEWLRVALDGLPEPLKNIKFDLARRFAQLLRRQTSLNHLCQASRSVLHSSDITQQMLDDWAHVDLGSICKQTLYTMDAYSDREHQMIVTLYKEFQTLLEEQAPIESYTEWLDSMVDRCVVRPSSKKPGSVRRIARQFLLMWSCFGTRVIRDMTLHSAPSFGSFHLLHLMFDDYVLYLVESLHSQERATDLLRSAQGQDNQLDAGEELILPQPSVAVGVYSPAGSDSGPPSHGLTTDRQSVITDTREAYTTSSYGSPTNTMSGQEAGSPPQPMTQFDTRMEGDMTPHPTPTPQVDNSMSSESQYSYGRYISPMTPHSVTSSVTQDANSAYNYGYAGNSSQTYGYMGRDLGGNGRESGLETWSDPQRYGHSHTHPHSQNTATLSQVAGSQMYSSYGQSRGVEYDTAAHAYSYDANIYTSAARAPSHVQHGVIYQHYNTESSYYGNNNEIDMSRKRKHDPTDQMHSGKRTSTDYGYPLVGSYARA